MILNTRLKRLLRVHLLIASLSAHFVIEGAELPGDREAPFTVAEGLFDADQHPHYGLGRAPGAETITIFAPRDDTDKFSNGVQVYPFNGWLYAQWQSTPRHEDTHDGRVVWSRSRDGKNWEEPRELARQPEEGGLMRSGAGFWSDGNSLVAYFQRVDSWYPGTIKMTEARITLDGENWSPIQRVSDTLVVAENIKELESGRLLTGVHTHLPGSTRMYGVIAYTDQRDGLGGWRMAEMPQPDSAHPRYGRGIEHSWYRRSDGQLVMVFRDMNRSGYLLASEGTNNGEHWTAPVRTEMPDSNSMQCAGNLPDGTVFIVNNPTRNQGRVPLTITLSATGEYFDRAYIVRGADDLQPRRYDGRHKDPGYSYPGAVIWGDHLYIAYATNKEDAEVTRIPLASLKVNGDRK